MNFSKWIYYSMDMCRNGEGTSVSLGTLLELVGARDLRTLWSPPVSLKRAKKKNQKNPGINPGQPAGKGQKRKKKKKKKTLVLTLGSPSDLDFRTWSCSSRFCSSVEVLKPKSTPGQTDTMFAFIYKMEKTFN
jgi:hypothetical protein